MVEHLAAHRLDVAVDEVLAERVELAADAGILLVEQARLDELLAQ